MKMVCSFSGGRTSAFMCHLLKQKFGDDVDFVYIDTGLEHEKTYEFIRKVNDEFGLNLVCIKAVFTQELGVGPKHEVIDLNDLKYDEHTFSSMINKHGLPAYNIPFCTDRLKNVPFRKYADQKYGKRNYLTWLGIRVDEPRRLSKMMPQQEDAFDEPKETYYRFLAEISSFTKEDIIGWWQRQSFDLDLPHETSGNCLFCVHKSPAKVALSILDNPDEAISYGNMIASDKVRIRNEDKKELELSMYRNEVTYAQNKKLAESSTREELVMFLKGFKGEDKGMCADSCEAFSNAEYNPDLFDELENEA